MRRIVISLLAAMFLAVGAVACEPKECKQFKDVICEQCGAKSPACRTVRKRRGRDEKKCKKAVTNVKRRVKTAQGKKALCTLLNDKVATTGK